MRVSICIPTYNRATELRLLLDSILIQTGHDLDIEIAISDNGSTDDTADVVANYRAQGLVIVYDRLVENRGYDRNILNAVAIASGQFCWLFGSDDILEPGALEKLSQSLRRHPDVDGLSVGSQAYNADFTTKLPDKNQVRNFYPVETVLTGRDATIAGLHICLGFVSSVIVRRERWQAAIGQSALDRYLSGYIHLYLVARMLDAQTRWVCLPARLVGYRTGNDSFSGTNEFARSRLDVVGFDIAFGDTLGRSSPAYRRAMAMVAVHNIGGQFLDAKLHGVSAAYWREAIPTTVSHYWRYPAFWVRTLPVALVPRPVFLAARSLYRNTLKPLRARRLS